MLASLLLLILANSFAGELVATPATAATGSAPSCLQSCETYYQKNPDARPQSMDGVCVEGAVSKVTKHISPLDCVNGAWKGVLTLPEQVRAYLTIVDNVGTYINKNIEAHRTFVKECSQSLECKRELGRNLQFFSAKKSDGSWFVPDSEVETYVKKLDIMSLLDQVSHHRNGMQNYCTTLLTPINDGLRREGLMSYDFAKARYERLLKKDPQCIGALQMTPPEPPPPDVERPQQSWSQWFDEKGIQLQCYPPGKVSELWCYQLGAFVADPLTLTGVGAVGGKLAMRAVVSAGLRRAEQKAAATAALETARDAFKVERVSAGENHIIRLSDDLNEVGYLQYERKGTVIEIDFVESNAKSKGVATAAFDQMLKDNPKVTLIRSSLALDNKRIVKDAMANGLSCIEAIKLSPAYKIRAKFGWTKIIKAHCPANENYTLEVAKP